MIDEREEGTKDPDDEAEAAHHDEGQDQEPKQAGETESIFDTEEHSDAPGPFGTGSSATAGPKSDDEDDEDDE